VFRKFRETTFVLLLNSKVSLDELSLCFDAPLQRIRQVIAMKIAAARPPIAVLSKRESKKAAPA